MSKVDILVPLYKPEANGWPNCEIALKGVPDHCQVLTRDDTENKLGFTGNVNELLKMSSAPYVLVLNQDTEITPGYVEALISRMEASARAAVVSGQVRDMVERKAITWGGSGACYPVGIHKVGYEGDLDKPTREPWITFVAPLIRREALTEVGLLDPNLIQIYSDSDWCLRARAFDWECWYEPNGIIYHQGNVSQKTTPTHMADYLYFTDKWIGAKLFEELGREIL